MLKVKTKLGLSKIEGAGIGLFADEFIAKDTIIWTYDENIDRVYSKEEYDKIKGLDKEFLHIYVFKFCGKYYLCVDNARFYNHSDNPNSYSSEFNENSLGYTKALRNIEIGEELTDNYNQFGFYDEDNKFNDLNNH